MGQKTLWLMLLFVGISVTGQPLAATETFLRELCPSPITTEPLAQSPGGAIWTTFDARATWAFEVDSGRRYPLSETAPCTRNCRLSPDATWMVYFNPLTYAFNQTRLNGASRQLIIDRAAHIEWWEDDRFLVWTPGRRAFIYDRAADTRTELPTSGGVFSIQPGGRWGVRARSSADGFVRELIDLNFGVRAIALGDDRLYFNALAWTADGSRLAYVLPITRDDTSLTAELFVIDPETGIAEQWTDLQSIYGAARINGIAVGELSWSPDASRIAFWVVPLDDSDPETGGGNARIHVVDAATQRITAYCAVTIRDHTPNPPRLVWSPDGSHLAFGVDLPDDDRRHRLLALDPTTGVVTVLSENLIPANGAADVIAWGLLPTN